MGKRSTHITLILCVVVLATNASARQAPRTSGTKTEIPSDIQRTIDIFPKYSPSSSSGGSIPRAEVSNQGPFGFRWGMTRDQVIALVGKDAIEEKYSRDDQLRLRTAPKPHPDFDGYLVTISPQRGLVKLLASGKTIETTRYGDEVHRAFEEI